MYFYKVFFTFKNGFQEYYSDLRKWRSPILRFFAGGTEDTIIDQYLLSEKFYYFTLGENAWNKNA